MIEALARRFTAWCDGRRRKRALAKQRAVLIKMEAGTLTDAELIYSAHARCDCGAGMAYPEGIGPFGHWDCSDILTGRAAPIGSPKSKKHTAKLPFTFYDVKSERQPSARGATTRPK